MVHVYGTQHTAMSFIWLLFILQTAFLLVRSVPEKPKRSALNQLTRTLLRRYDCGVRPIQDWTSPTTVYIDLILQSVLDVDGKTQSVTASIWYRQIWTDEFLVWDPEEFDGITEISLSSDAIWIPDVIVSEFVDEGKSPPIPYVYVNSSGTVRNYRPIQAVLACNLEMYAFPFDKQNCTLTFRSWLHSVSEIDLALWRSADTIANDKREFMNDGEWELLSIPSRYWRLHQGDLDYAQIQFDVLIRRRPLLYVVGLLLPSLFLMVADVTSFYLPADGGMRIAFKISILLGYTVFRVNLMDEMPHVAVRTPIIGVFFAVCMALLMLSLAKSIVVVKLLHHGDKEVQQMSVSAYLLDKYGSLSHSLTQSAFTSTRTLDDATQSAGYEFDLPPAREDLLFLTGCELPDIGLPSPGSGSSSGGGGGGRLLEPLHQELVSLRRLLCQDHQDHQDPSSSSSSYQSDWAALCTRLDLLLFRAYLLILAVYACTLLLLWLSWSLG